jgi:amino acid adenylation domain-containing protein
MMHAQEHLAGLLEQHALLYPENPAVISKAGVTSYGELIRYVDRLSAWLEDWKVVREQPIAVCADRSLAWIVGALGVLQAGGVYIPIDPMTPLQRKVEMLKNAGVRLVLIEPHLPTELPDSFELAILDANPPAENLAREKPEIYPGQAAYGMYTSGSTGTPKNVIVSHDSLLNYAVALRREFKLTCTDRYLHTASLAFSSSIRQLIAPLVSGATVVVATREEIRSPESLIGRMLQTGVTILDIVPSYLKRLLPALWDCPPDWRDRLSLSLRLVVSASEPVSATTLNSVRTLFPKVRILNLFGQTETTGVVAKYEVQAVEADPIPIGAALGPYNFYVLDEQLNPADEGELYISGPCLARCYQGRPDTTAAQFCPDPFTTTEGTRMYRTGDRVRSLDNGFFEFKGRKDDQVKVRGIRIELGEIDAGFLKHPDILEAATVLRPLGAEDMRLVAFAVIRPGRICPGAEALRAFLATILTDAAIPAIIVFVDQLPRTISGKIDRPALISRDIGPPTKGMSSAVPRTSMERIVAKCWEDVLQVSGIGVDDDFFALGGDSMQAITMTLRLQKLLPVQTTLVTLFFQDPVLKAFANAIEMEADASVALIDSPSNPAQG